MGLRITKASMVLLVAGLISACTPKTSESVADSIYTGGNIITINDTQPSAESVAVKDGKILAVGSLKQQCDLHGSWGLIQQ